MSKKKSKLDKLTISNKKQIKSALDRSMQWIGNAPEPIGTIQYYGLNCNDNQSKVERNRNG